MNTSDTFDGPAALARHADDAYEAIRAINHLTAFTPVLPAPDLYPVLGSLTLLGHGLQQALDQLATGLGVSPDFYDLTEDDPDRDPADSISSALSWLTYAADQARQLGHACGQAQTAIAGQGWHGADEPDNPAQDLVDDAGDELDGADR